MATVGIAVTVKYYRQDGNNTVGWENRTGEFPDISLSGSHSNIISTNYSEFTVQLHGASSVHLTGWYYNIPSEPDTIFPMFLEFIKYKVQTTWELGHMTCSSPRHPLFYTRSHLIALQNCALIFSTSFYFIFTLKKCTT